MSAKTGAQKALHFLFDTVPAAQESRIVCEGIRWIRLPLPFALDHVNCWLLGEPGDQVLIDTGVSMSKSRDQWQWHFGKGKQGGLHKAPEKLLVTHFHPDHTGLAGWFAAAGSRLYGSAVEVGISLSLRDIDDEVYGEHYARWYGANGLPAPQIEAVRRNANTYRLGVDRLPGESSWTFLQEGQRIELAGENYRVLTGRGHSPDMLMLYRERDHVLIAADQILPSISPNVSVMPRLKDQSPLHSYLSTLDALKVLPADTLVLPSHGVPFKGLHERIAALEQHHEERLDEVWRACAVPSSAHDLFSVLFRRTLDAQQTSFALGESLAHLHYLEQTGRAERLSDDDGIARFQRIG